ncbi:hypothetical protein Gorai_000360 [Gossypium raimondii]|uniref:Uncharacterized protein n=1 Tax=Gossypium raimondii TaxID=29730 RepID=A0A7J8PDE8_GOSRA|nr:hypothetical protein [Gossypium raimondii]
MASKLAFLHINGAWLQYPELQHSNSRLFPKKINSISGLSGSFSEDSSSSLLLSRLLPLKRTQTFLSPKWLDKNPDATRTLIVKSQLNCPLISPNDQWGTWTALFATGAFGLWSENTKAGSALSGALVSTLIGLAASNLGIISSEAKVYSIVKEFLLPLAVPLLLFRADLRRVIKSTGKLLLAFLLGSGNSAPSSLDGHFNLSVGLTCFQGHDFGLAGFSAILCSQTLILGIVTLTLI